MQTAIRKSAFYRTHYAIILEDDISFNFNIDFKCLLQLAPKDFGAIQLVTSNLQQINSTWNNFKYNKTNLFSIRTNECWSTQGYIINTAIVRDYVMKAMDFNRNNLSYQLNIIPLGLFQDICKNGKFNTDHTITFNKRIYDYSLQSQDMKVFKAVNDINKCWLPEALYV